MKKTVFYSWQSDTKAAANRSLIETALDAAVRDIAADASIDVEPAIDRDTANVAGSPDIGATILAKIRAADVVVADVSIINSESRGRLTPNPNVLVEVGYALATHSESGLILVLNTAFGGPEDLPFDLRQKRCLCYESPAEDSDRATPRRKLQADLRKAIAAVLGQKTVEPVAVYPIDLRLGYKTREQSGILHTYQLRVTVKNIGTRRINEWHVTVDMPRALLTKEQFQAANKEASTKVRAVFRFDEKSNGTIYPDAAKILAVEYRVDQTLFQSRPEVFKDSVEVRAYIEGEVGGVLKRPVRELQQF